VKVHAKTGLTPVSGSRVWRRSGMGEVWRGRQPARDPGEGGRLDPGPTRHSAPPPRIPLHRTAAYDSRLLSYQVAKTRRIGSAAAKCSNQADLHLTFTDPI
jgi:hypothetical protein